MNIQRLYVLFDATTGLTFSEASGEYQAPDRVHAKIKAQFGGTLLELEVDKLHQESGFAFEPVQGRLLSRLPPVALYDRAHRPESRKRWWRMLWD